MPPKKPIEETNPPEEGDTDAVPSDEGPASEATGGGVDDPQEDDDDG